MHNSCLFYSIRKLLAIADYHLLLLKTVVEFMITISGGYSGGRTEQSLNGPLGTLRGAKFFLVRGATDSRSVPDYYLKSQANYRSV